MCVDVEFACADVGKACQGPASTQGLPPPPPLITTAEQTNRHTGGGAVDCRCYPSTHAQDVLRRLWHPMTNHSGASAVVHCRSTLSVQYSTVHYSGSRREQIKPSQVKSSPLFSSYYVIHFIHYVIYNYNYNYHLFNSVNLVHSHLVFFLHHKTPTSHREQRFAGPVNPPKT